MGVLNQLDPAPLWSYFEEICKIPRISKNEEGIRKYLLDFAVRNNLEAKEDTIGNILITREASEGYKLRKTVVLQSHLDMVGEKNADHPHNWETDPIKPVIKGDWVSASGTTLGADDGIGIAAQMAVLTDKNLQAGKIECLFTVDEESGMTGAINLSPDFFTGRTLINLDSEDEGILFIGCAGGLDTVGVMHYDIKPSGKGKTGLEISVTGLHGGHSGDEIHKGYGNSVKIINRVLLSILKKKELSVSSFDAGNLRNAIPREAFVTISIKKEDLEEIIQIINDTCSIISDELGDLDPWMKCSVREVSDPMSVMDSNSMMRLIHLINCCPHGVLAWSKEMEDLVETSTNLASVKLEHSNKIRIVSTQRSSVETSRDYAANMVESCMRLAGADVTHSEGYPGWKPDLRSEILHITKESYKKLFGKEPYVRAIHAGLECGLIYKKISNIDMISFGPTIRGAHTPEEKIEISTVQLFSDLLNDLLKNIPER